MNFLKFQVYLVDYGLATKYQPDGKHKDYKEDPRKVHDGTIEFTSIDAHRGAGRSISTKLICLGWSGEWEVTPMSFLVVVLWYPDYRCDVLYQ